MNEEKPPLPVVSIHGVPRSGTSWLGEIFNSNPYVAYRFQPLFAYSMRGSITDCSNLEELSLFFNNALKTRDPFILQKGKSALGPRIPFQKKKVRTLVLKMVRFHDLLPVFMKYPNFKAILIIRHPCGVINSWINTPREFDPDWPLTEWKHAVRKNQNKKEEWFGFEKWKEFLYLSHQLKREYSNRVFLVSYEDLAKRREHYTKNLFHFSFGSNRIPMQTRAFLNQSESDQKSAHNYSIIKSKSVIDAWDEELPSAIKASINTELSDIKQQGLFPIPSLN